MRSSFAVRRAVVAAGALFAALLLLHGWPVSQRAARSAEPPRFPSAGTAATCFAVLGASWTPGLRCVVRPTVEDVRPAPPCDDAGTRTALAGLLARCPLDGRALRLAPERDGGPCMPRLEPLPAALKLALGRPLDLATATPEDLEALPGVGPATARAIVRARDAAGGRRLELDAVPGIGARRAATLTPLLAPAPPDPPGCRTVALPATRSASGVR